jgi:putative PIN family toxin of toxin-antitoxin system
MLRVVLDTNALLRSLSRKSIYKSILDKLYEGDCHIFLTNEILLEYEEKISDIFTKETAELTVGALSLLVNVHKIDVHYRLQLIESDQDDNKFVDCAFAANAHYLVTDDKHFSVLNSIEFPKINTISLTEFKEILSSDL